jgi:hypothetical protein
MKVRFNTVLFPLIFLNILDDFISIGTDSKTNLTETRNRCQTISGISVSMLKIDKSTRNEGNPGIKPPLRSISEDEEGDNQRIRRYKTTENKASIQVTRVRSKRPVMRHQSSINDRCPSFIANTIYLNDSNEFKSASDTFNTNKIPNPPSKSKSAANRYKLFTSSNFIKSGQKKIKRNVTFHLKPIVERVSKEKH